jgi:hypothetical protein
VDVSVKRFAHFVEMYFGNFNQNISTNSDLQPFFATVVGKFQFLTIWMNRQQSLVGMENKLFLYLKEISHIISETIVVGIHQN